MNKKKLTDEEYDLILKRALLENIEFENKNIPAENEIDHEFSSHFKRNMNRIFREYTAVKKTPYPDVDNIFEKTRSNIILYSKKIIKNLIQVNVNFTWIFFVQPQVAEN